MKLKQVIRLATGLAVAGAVFESSAEETNAPGRVNPPPEGRPQPSFAPGRPLVGLGPIMNVLTEEQRASMQQALMAQREKLREVDAKIRDARRQMFEASLSGTFDEEAVRKQALALANLEAEMTVLRIKALSQVQPPLTPDQIDRIKNAPAPGAAPGARPVDRPVRRRILQNENRDENDLPPKQ